MQVPFYTAERAWQAAGGQPIGWSTLQNFDNHANYAPLEVVAASGRARCKMCGEKILRGVPTITFVYSEGSSYTSQRVYIHYAPCMARGGYARRD